MRTERGGGVERDGVAGPAIALACLLTAALVLAAGVAAALLSAPAGTPQQPAGPVDVRIPAAIEMPPLRPPVTRP